MNNAVSFGISLVGVSALVLGFIVGLRAKQQFGFLSPLGFACAVLLRLVCFAMLMPLNFKLAEEVNKEKLREVADTLSMDDKLWCLSAAGHGSGIWQMGAVFFLLCGFLDIRAAKGEQNTSLRYVLIILGTLLIAFSACYAPLMTYRLLF